MEHNGFNQLLVNQDLEYYFFVTVINNATKKYSYKVYFALFVSVIVVYASRNWIARSEYTPSFPF